MLYEKVWVPRWIGTGCWHLGWHFGTLALWAVIPNVTVTRD